MLNPRRISESSASAAEKDHQMIDFEQVLFHVGAWGRYQKSLLLLFFLICTFTSYVVYAPVLFLHVPDHWCRPHPSFENSSLTLEEVVKLTVPVDEVTGERSSCLLYDVQYDESFLKHLPSKNSSEIPWSSQTCPYGWNYNYTGYFTSAATDMNWVCDDSWKGPFTQSMFSVGGIVGTIIFGYMADRYGRFPTFFGTNLLMFTTGIATPFCTDFISFSAVRFIMGLTYDTTIRTFFLIALEFVTIDKRSLIGTLSFAVGFTFGGCYISWLLKYLGDWKIFHHILFAQTAVIFFTPLFVHESVRWLAAEGRIHECKKILKSIAKTNGKVPSEKFYDDFARMAEQEHRDASRLAKLTWVNLFKTPRLRKNTILMVLTWMTIYGLFDGHIRNTDNLTSSFYVTFTVAAGLELPADLLVIWGMDNIGRRWSVSISLMLSGLCMIVCGVCIGQSLVINIFSMLGRFWMIYAMCSGQQYVFEVFPTSLRAQGSALATVFASFAQFFAPYVAYSSVITPSLPFFLLGAGGIFGSAISIFLPETAGVDLPHTIDQAEAFAKGMSFFFVPILHVKAPPANSASTANMQESF